jgi:hypothetical protein
MKSIQGRLSKLEHRFGIADDRERFIVILDGAGSTRALSNDRCIQILDEAGLLPTGGVATVDLTQIPTGLNAEETKRFVRDNGARICGSCRVGGPGMESDAGRRLRPAVPAEFKVELDHWKAQPSAERPGSEEVR